MTPVPCPACGATLKDSAGPCPSCGRAGTPNPDLEHLKWLSIFHYVLAAITALFSCFPLIHVALGVLLATGSLDDGAKGGSPQAFGLIFAIVGCSFVAGGWALAAAMFMAGRNLVARRRHTFCIVVAALSCLFMPFGTVLGVFTLIVLMRPSVKALFDPPKELPSA
jgi:hypothetical protein